MGRRVGGPLVTAFTWGCHSVDLRCVQWREGCRFGDFLVRCSVIIDLLFFSLSVCLSFFSSLVINVCLAYCWVGNMCPCQLSVSGFEGNLFELSRPGRPMIAALALMGLPSLTTNLCFVSGKLVLLINMFFMSFPDVWWLSILLLFLKNKRFLIPDSRWHKGAEYRNYYQGLCSVVCFHDYWLKFMLEYKDMVWRLRVEQ